MGAVNNASGLITPASTDNYRTNSFNKTDVKDIIRYPLGGKVNSENGTNAGKGTVINKTNRTNEELRKGEVDQR